MGSRAGKRTQLLCQLYDPINTKLFSSDRNLKELMFLLQEQGMFLCKLVFFLHPCYLLSSSIDFRHCCWILGNERTLCNSESVWETLLLDAKIRQCFVNADEDKDLAKSILEVKKRV